MFCRRCHIFLHTCQRVARFRVCVGYPLSPNAALRALVFSVADLIPLPRVPEICTAVSTSYKVLNSLSIESAGDNSSHASQKILFPSSLVVIGAGHRRHEAWLSFPLNVPFSPIKANKNTPRREKRPIEGLVLLAPVTHKSRTYQRHRSQIYQVHI